MTNSLNTSVLFANVFLNLYSNKAFCIKSSYAFLGRLKLTVLSEDRLQMKWKEAEGPVQGYKVRVRPIAGETAVNGN